MIVTDASVIIDVLLRSAVAGEIEEIVFDPRQTLHAPHLLDVEVAQVIRRHASRGEVSSMRGKMMLDLLASFPITRYPHRPLVDRIWALRANMTAYDAAYVALAEGLGGTLLTRDARLAGAGGHRAKIRLISH